MEDEKKKSMMDILFKKTGRVPDKGVQEGKKSIAEIIGMKKKKQQESEE